MKDNNLTSIEELLDNVIKSIEIRDPKLKAVTKNWKNQIIKAAEFENKTNSCVHRFTEDTTNIIENFFRIALKMQLLETKRTKLRHELRINDIEMKESLAIYDGFSFDEQRHQLCYASLMVGQLREEVIQQIHLQLYQYSLFCLGEIENSGNIEIHDEFAEWNVAYNISVAEYVEKFQPMISRLQQHEISEIKKIITDCDLASDVANNANNHLIIRLLALLVLEHSRIISDR
ncbi:hypothetical protein [Rhodohalobacter mucosus]|nr:hypothetical protein [Rhodohalobacter mucosus]